MPTLTKPHRTLLDNVTGKARLRAEAACRAALENLAVPEKDYRAHMSPEQRELRNRLRARGRALGDSRRPDGTQDIRHLTELAAYEHWHRLLFTRFLTENNLLLTDDANSGVPITLDECEELAPELGARDGLDLACRFASRILPGVFRRDDPVLELNLALNDQIELRSLLAALPGEVFRADDALGWTYQFWQAQRKDEINASGRKIGADELSPVTQLFTEDYMVDFLLHNTLGAWWAGKVAPILGATESEARDQAHLPSRDGLPGIAWTNLRLVRDEETQTWSPAAGTFDGWPRVASAIRLLDPCMGSGHFLAFALPLLARLRMEEEDLTPRAAVYAVIRDNLYGLEIDERCTQIAAFNVALAGWKLAGYQELPLPHLACCGLLPVGTETEWKGLAKGNARAEDGMANLHRLFQHAPILGSLIDARSQVGTLYCAGLREVFPLLTNALSSSSPRPKGGDPLLLERAFLAQGLAKAAELLGDQFTLVATNVPYLGRGKQSNVLKDFCNDAYADSKADLATCFIERCLRFCAPGSTIAIVAPQNWLFMPAYQAVRKKLLSQTRIDVVAWLGANAFQDMNFWAATTALSILSASRPSRSHRTFAIDASGSKERSHKQIALSSSRGNRNLQSDQLLNPDARITFDEVGARTRLGGVAITPQGLKTGDDPRFRRNWWELGSIGERWRYCHGAPDLNRDVDGACYVVDCQNGFDDFARPQGMAAWGKRGVVIKLMGGVTAARYFGELFDSNVTALVPGSESDLSALWLFVQSEEFRSGLRSLEQAVKVNNATVGKASVDMDYWRRLASVQYPQGLPRADSADPTQWVFAGHPSGSEQPLHVAIARLLGYQWPRQSGSTFLDCSVLSSDGLDAAADEDGIVALAPIRGEQPAASRLRGLLAAALGTVDERGLLATAGPKGSKSITFEDWLRDEFFEQHVRLFNDRPFIWHIWDGRIDGFHVLVNYHKLGHTNLQKVTYSYLGDWIRRQDEDTKADKPGAAARLGAARALQAKLSAILQGEAPLDLFARWKALKDQPLGWHPDLNDGVRQNIRPFLLAGDVAKKGAGLFRAVPLKLKDKDRGTEPIRTKEDYPWFWCEREPGTDPTGGDEFVGSRWNQVHLTLAKKRKARNDGS